MSLEKHGAAEFEVELERLTQALMFGKENKMDLVAFMHDAIVVFEKAEASLRIGSPREKELVYRKLQELGSLVEKNIETVSKETGKTEEEMSAYVENPDNFTQDAWAAIQKANRQILIRKKRKRQPLSGY